MLGDRAIRRRLRIEPLEGRFVLDSSLDAFANAPDPNWFASFEAPVSIAFASENARGLSEGLSSGTHRTPFVGPKFSHPSDWIVRLNESSKIDVGFEQLDHLLSSNGVHFETIRGLGVPGLVQVRAFAATADAAESALFSNRNVASFEPNALVSAKRFPNDSDFGNLVGLHNVGQFGGVADADIDAVEAWDQTTGSSSVVVGVIDSGIDVSHPDLYLNVWLNQGEIRSETKAALVDTDGDGLFTFYDLNSNLNAGLVRDLNLNGYIDAIDLLEDPLWSDGLDSDRNGFIDDFFGWNFRTGTNEPYAPNNPSDSLGHGTHVAGTIGATGNNAIGVTGVNWRTSLMSLKFLDQNNQGDTASAIAAVHYATLMRTRYATNVRVLNSSWGQSGSPNSVLRNSIEAAGDAGILFVAASGNGNVLGQGVDNDRTPFYPASYDLDNILAVAASDSSDRLASFSNYGLKSVDIAAPGVGIRSTLPGGSYGEANGTSMAAPFVSGAAALIWSQLPQATVAEVRKAILDTADLKTDFSGVVAAGGRLNALSSVEAPIFAPVATVVDVKDIVSSGAASQEIVVQYSDRNGLDATTIGDNDLRIQHQWGARDQFSVSLKQGSVQVSADRKSILATYIMSPPGGVWDPLDYGTYSIVTTAGAVLSQRAGNAIRSQVIGEFAVKIIDPSVIYVDTPRDSVAGMSLRNAIEISNSNPLSPRTIILQVGQYTLELPHQSSTSAGFFTPSSQNFCTSTPLSSAWSDSSSGDLDILGDLTIVGDSKDSSTIEGNSSDRVFKVHPGASLTLKRLAVTGGVSPSGQGGGGILSAGQLRLDQVRVQDNRAVGSQGFVGRGGGIAAWAGTLDIVESQITENQGDFGGGVFLCGNSISVIDRSTIDNNRGGGLVSYSASNSILRNTTVASNFGGAIASRARDFAGGTGISYSPAISRDGQRVAYLSNATNLIAGDTNAVADVFVYDMQSGSVDRASVSTSLQQANQASESPAISGDGSKVAFLSSSNNLVGGDTLFSKDVFTRDLTSRTTNLESTSSNANRDSRGLPAISDDGRILVYQQFVADDVSNSWGVFIADRSTGTHERIPLAINGNGVSIAYFNANEISGDGRFVSIASGVSGTADENYHDVFVFDRIEKTLVRPNLRTLGAPANGSNYDPSLDVSGRFMAFTSDDSGIVVGDTNQASDVFIYDALLGSVVRVSQSKSGAQANQASSNASVSGDGRYVAFESLASNLVPGDTNSLSDVFVVDRLTGDVERVSLASDSTESNGASYSPSISGDGRYIAFESEANNLDASLAIHRTPSGPSHRQVYVFDRMNRTVKSISEFNQKSTVQVSSSTVVFNTGEATLSGNVSTIDSLYAGNLVGFDLGAKTYSSGNNVVASAINTSLLQNNDIVERVSSLQLGSFSSQGQLPPGYPLLLGNPAIDAGSTSSTGTFDQWNQLRVKSDIGALEAVSATVKGSVFADLNANLAKETNEQGLPELVVFLDANGDGVLQAEERSTTTSLASSNAGNPVEAGSFEFQNLSPSKNNIRVAVPNNWQASADPLQRVGVGSIQGNGNSSLATVSPSGRVVAFVSTATNLVAGDDANPSVFVFERDRQSIVKVPVGGANLQVLGIVGGEEQYVLLRNDLAVYLYDRNTLVLEPISVTNSGELGDARSDSASASSDGQWIAFSSFANNLVANDNDNFADIFLFNRTTKTVESISIAANGVQGNNDSEEPHISDDGRFVAFVSDANNLVPNDRNGLGDVFVYDRIQRTIQRVNVSSAGAESNGFTFAPAISGNGRHIVFQSLASNLVPGDTNARSDLFVLDRVQQSLEKLNISFPLGSQAANVFPSISSDGQYVVFESRNSVVNPADNSTTKNVFVYDRYVAPAGGVADGTSNNSSPIRLVSKPLIGLANNGDSQRASLSSDGRSIVFESSSSNLVTGDSNERSDIFISPNPFETASRTLALQVGQEWNPLNIGLVPNPGDIRGTIYDDLNSNSLLDDGETGLFGWVVYLDLDFNGRRDVGEPISISQLDGSYRFSDVPSFRSYAIGTEMPSGWESTTLTENPSSNALFLPAGGIVEQRDFGFRPQSTTGQFENARIEGRVFNDTNGDGIAQTNELGSSGIEVYLDLNGNERRDFDEPRNITDSQGNYSFGNLGSRSYTVRTSLPEGTRLTSPLGNKFNTTNQTLSSNSTLLSKPQHILLDDFDGKNGPDSVVALYSGNAILVQLNDGTGRLQPNPTPISLAPNGLGPIAIASGQLNGSGSKDLVVANSLSGTVSVLFDFNVSGFAQATSVALGAIPSDIKLADIDSDGDLDIIVATQNGNQTGQIRILLNNGAGVFSVGNSLSSGGKRPASVVTGDFNLDQKLDIAVANQGDFGRANDNGNVAVLFGRANGTFESPVAYVVGSSPLSLDVGDLNGDGFQDLVTANFSVNTASVLRGSSNGAFTVLRDPLSVGQGPVQIALVDIDGDRDKDILVSNLRSKSLSILRNRSSQDQVENPNGLVFEPSESFGVAELSIGPRLVFDAADIDRSGTIDLALVNSETNALQILSNELIGGANRVQLNGVGTTRNQNFGTRSQILPPRLNSIAGPIELLEDSGSASIPLTGIARGRTSGPPLRITVSSSNPLLIPAPTIDYTPGATEGRIQFSPAPDANGSAILQVVVRDAGADGVFDTSDDGTAQQSVSVMVKPVNDRPTIQLRGNQLATMGSNLRTISRFATAFETGGGSDEQTQAMAEIIVNNNRTDLFLVQPTIDNEGNLRFQTSLTNQGVATISVQVRDNGGTDAGGMDRSAIQTFQITVTDLADGEIDFGDAPSSVQSEFAASYPTQIKDNGARHVISNLFLGSFVDAELDGNASANALGDDLAVDDEDGVVFPVSAIASPNLPTISSVVVTGSGNSKLDAWVDFNQDGDWNDSGEQILSGANVLAGSQFLSFTIPAGAKSGTTYGRFRLSSAGGLSPTGLAEDGEVEDYAISILDGQTNNTVTLDATEFGDHDVLLSDGQLVVRAFGKTVFSAPAGSLDRVKLAAPTGSSTYEIQAPSSHLFGTLQYRESGQSVTMVPAVANVDLTRIPNGSLQGVEILDFTASSAQTLMFNAANIASFNAEKTLRITLGSQDTVQTTDAWVLSTRLNESVGIVNVFRQSGATIRITSPTSWQNPVNRFDADGDGILSPLDVLAVMNYINRSSGTNSASALPVLDAAFPLAHPFVDVNGNGASDPLDVLEIINEINRLSR
jgi:subtilisin family serine protease